MLLLSIKIVVLFPLTYWFGIKRNGGIAVSLVLAQSGEFALVLFALANATGLLDETLFQHLLIVVLLSMLATPTLDKFAYKIFMASNSNTSMEPAVKLNEENQLEHKKSPVVLVGFGRMGHRIGYIMELMKLPYVAIDSDASLVDRERAEGKAVYYGDAQRPEVLRAAGAADAPFVIVSTDDLEATEHVVSSFHSVFPDMPVFARGHDLINCCDLRELGAHFTVSETLEASGELARAALLNMGADEKAIAIALDQFRSDYYGRINKCISDE